MGVYDRYILPKVVHFACGMKPNMRQRAKVVPHAHGRVLEVGIGSGLNLPFYDSAKVSKVWGLDPSPEMTHMARQAAVSLPFEVEFIGLPGDEIPLEDGSIDTVVITYTLCTIPDTGRKRGQVLQCHIEAGYLRPRILACNACPYSMLDCLPCPTYQCTLMGRFPSRKGSAQFFVHRTRNQKGFISGHSGKLMGHPI